MKLSSHAGVLLCYQVLGRIREASALIWYRASRSTVNVSLVTKPQNFGFLLIDPSATAQVSVHVPTRTVTQLQTLLMLEAGLQI